jgi:hypothetical protein
LAVNGVYKEVPLSVFHDPLQPKKSDWWYGSCKNKKHAPRPSFSSTHTFSNLVHFNITFPLILLLPLTRQPDWVSAAIFKNWVHTVSEWLLANIFYPLSYGTTANLAANRLKAVGQ